MLTFNKKYFLLTILILVIEILIATWIKTGFIRHYVGDYLVVVLIYCFVKSFFKIPMLYAVTGVLLFAYFIELLQYLDVLKLLSLGDNPVANIVLGNYFDWGDILAYTLGIATVLAAEFIKTPEKIDQRIA